MTRPQRFVIERHLGGSVLAGELPRHETGHVLRLASKRGAQVLPEGGHCFTIIDGKRTDVVMPLEAWDERNAPDDDELEHDAAAARAWWYA